MKLGDKDKLLVAIAEAETSGRDSVAAKLRFILEAVERSESPSPTDEGGVDV